MDIRNTTTNDCNIYPTIGMFNWFCGIGFGGWDYFEILAICENNRKEFLKLKRNKNLRYMKEIIKTQLKIRFGMTVILLHRKTVKGTYRYHKHRQIKLYLGR